MRQPLCNGFYGTKSSGWNLEPGRILAAEDRGGSPSSSATSGTVKRFLSLAPWSKKWTFGHRFSSLQKITLGEKTKTASGKISTHSRGNFITSFLVIERYKGIIKSGVLRLGYLYYLRGGVGVSSKSVNNTWTTARDSPCEWF